MTARSERGFSLIEALVAVSLLVVAVVGVAQLAMAAARSNAETMRAGVAQQAAREKLEQLRSLAWTSDAALVPISDWASDLTVTPAAAGGGFGLGVSPGGALGSNTQGYCDFLDWRGKWLAGGAVAPVGTAFVRRWSVENAAALADTLLLQVIVVPASAAGPGTMAAARSANGTWLVTLRARRSL